MPVSLFSQVLNPQLYSVLVEVFGEVRIANAGEAMIATYTASASRRCNLSIASSGEYYRVSCLFCSDTRHRLRINHRYGQLDPSRRPIKYLAHCYNENCLSDPKNRDQLYDRLFALQNRRFRGPGSVRDASSRSNFPSGVGRASAFRPRLSPPTIPCSPTSSANAAFSWMT